MLLGFFKGFSLLLVYEIIEELLEEAVAWTITTLMAKALSFLLVVVLTQFTKVTGKMIAKSLVLVLKPVVKRFTYKEGNDKLTAIKKLIRRIFKMDTEDVRVATSEQSVASKIKSFFAGLISYLKRNVKTVTSTVINFFTAIGSGTLLGGGLYVGEIDLPKWAYIVIGVALTIVMFVLTELGILGKGVETQAEYDTRKANEAAAKAEAAEKAKVKKAIEAELKQSEEEAKQVKAKLLEEQEAEKKAQEEAAIKQKAEALKAEYASAVANGTFTGSLEDWLKQQ